MVLKPTNALRWTLALQLGPAAVIQIVIAGRDLSSYAADVPGAVSVLFWMLAALATTAAFLGVCFTKPWWISPLVVSEALIALCAMYVLWVDYTSPMPDRIARTVAWGFLISALLVVLRFGAYLARIATKSWSAGLALISALGLAQFVLQNQVLPNRARPTVDVSVALTETSRSPTRSVLHGVATMKNNGSVSVTVVNGYLELRAIGDATRPDAALDARAVTATFSPTDFDYRPYTRTLPTGSPTGVIWLDELTEFGTFLPPGVTIRREFSVSVDRSRGTTFDLRASAGMFTNARLDPAQVRTCRGVASTTTKFVADAATPVVDPTGWNTTCYLWPIEARDVVRARLSDDPKLEFGYAFGAPAGHAVGSWLEEVSGEADPLDIQSRVRASKKIDHQNPGETLTTNATLDVKP